MNRGETEAKFQKQDLLSVVIPVFNEDLVIETSLKKIREIL